MTLNKLLAGLAVATLATVMLFKPTDATAGSGDSGVYVVDNVLYVQGDTTRYQAAQVALALQGGDVRRVVLSGKGGDLNAGFTIGTLIRRYGLTTQITSNTTCVSACAFAALGGTNVLVGGKLLFHRGFIPQVPIMVKLDDLARVNQSIAIITTHYLLTMGYSTQMSFDIANKTNPCRFMMVDSTKALREARAPDPLKGTKLKHEDYNYCEAGR